MSEYLGLFVDDDIKNFEAIRRQLALKNISLLPYEELPADIEDIYQRILDKNVDFVIIDYDLGKQAVKYTGIDVLKSIREQDAEIYIIYLTNKDFVEDHIGDFDQTVKKKDLAKEMDNVVKRLVRALSRDLAIKNERDIKMNYELQKKYLDDRIAMLKRQVEK